MFRVENADFIADKLAAELLPNQEFREVVKNALEAVERRLKSDGATAGGRIEFDVDWNLLAQTGRWYICCADNGDGMTRSQLERYTTTLAVQGVPLHSPSSIFSPASPHPGRRRLKPTDSHPWLLLPSSDLCPPTPAFCFHLLTPHS